MDELFEKEYKHNVYKAIVKLDAIDYPNSYIELEFLGCIEEIYSNCYNVTCIKKTFAKEIFRRFLKESNEIGCYEIRKDLQTIYIPLHRVNKITVEYEDFIIESDYHSL